VCELTDVEIVSVIRNGIKSQECSNCGSKDSVIDIELSLWLEEIEACDD
jgi:hypothetical protein